MSALELLLLGLLVVGLALAWLARLRRETETLSVRLRRLSRYRLYRHRTGRGRLDRVRGDRPVEADLATDD